jgi:cardiolipin hydrolase
MDPQGFDDLLLQTFEDQHLSRKEKQLLDEVLQDTQADEQKRGVYRHQAFEVARKALPGEEAGKVLAWLEDVVKVLVRGDRQTAAPAPSEALFSPADDCPARIRALFASARKKADVCVFTITDDRIASAILDAHRRGVAVRILSDDDKANDLGSDIERLHRAGVPVKVDASPHHMHHKFALFDDSRLLTGSYNWTRGAAEHNEENFIITGDAVLVARFARTFEKLWQEMKALG